MSKVALLTELLMDTQDQETNPIQASIATRHGDALKKAGIPDAAYKCANYGVQVLDPNMHAKIMDTLSKAGIQAVPDPKDNNMIVVDAK